MSEPNTIQQKVDALQQEVSAFISENLTDEMVQGARLGFGINRELGTRWHQAIHQRNIRSRFMLQMQCCKIDKINLAGICHY